MKADPTLHIRLSSSLLRAVDFCKDETAAFVDRSQFGSVLYGKHLDGCQMLVLLTISSAQAFWYRRPTKEITLTEGQRKTIQVSVIFAVQPSKTLRYFWTNQENHSVYRTLPAILSVTQEWVDALFTWLIYSTPPFQVLFHCTKVWFVLRWMWRGLKFVSKNNRFINYCSFHEERGECKWVDLLIRISYGKEGFMDLLHFHCKIQKHWWKISGLSSNCHH